MHAKYTLDELFEVATATVKNLRNFNIESGVFGSMGCAMYGARHRLPQDVDIIMLTTDDEWEKGKPILWNVERIKRRLVENDSDHFTLRPPKREEGKVKRFKKLFYKFYSNRACKVDLVFHKSPIIGIHRFPAEVLMYRRNNANRFDLPVVPLLTLIALKLKGWEWRPKDRSDQLEKCEKTDPADIRQLLAIAVQKKLLLNQVRWWPRWCKQEAQRRVNLFAKAHPDTNHEWEQLGFRV